MCVRGGGHPIASQNKQTQQRSVFCFCSSDLKHSLIRMWYYTKLCLALKSIVLSLIVIYCLVKSLLSWDLLL